MPCQRFVHNLWTKSRLCIVLTHKYSRIVLGLLLGNKKPPSQSAVLNFMIMGFAVLVQLLQSVLRVTFLQVLEMSSSMEGDLGLYTERWNQGLWSIFLQPPPPLPFRSLSMKNISRKHWRKACTDGAQTLSEGTRFNSSPE